MKQALAVSALLWITLPVGAAETSEWGQTVDGLRMSVAILSESSVFILQVRVTVNYLGRSPLLVPLGFATGDGISRYRLRLLVAAADSPHGFTLDDDKPIRGRFNPVVVPMARHASYRSNCHLPIGVLYGVPASLAMTPLPALLQRTVHLWVEWDFASFSRHG